MNKTPVIISNYDGASVFSIMVGNDIYEDEDLPVPFNTLVEQNKYGLYLRNQFEEDKFRELIMECYPEELFDVIICEDGHIEKLYK